MEKTINKNKLPVFPDFKDIESEDKRIFDDYFIKYPPDISELTFTNLFVWRASHPARWCILDEVLCIMRTDGKSRFYPPVGGASPCDILEQLRRYAEEKQIDFEMSRIPETMAGAFSNNNLSIIEDRANFDYVYKACDLADLPGRKYAAKRNLVNKCLREYSAHYIEITLEILDQCLSIQEQWCNMRRCDVHPPLAAEFQAIRETFSNYSTLHPIGGAIKIQGNIEAFSLAEPLNEDTAVFHFEKANPGITGLYQLINQSFVKESLSDFAFINREQDLGDEGLRRAKMSYLPDHFVKKYIVRAAP